MGKKSAPAPPPTPNYGALAQQQHELDLRAAERNARINRPNQITPYGRVTYTQGPNGVWNQFTTPNPAEQQILGYDRISRQKIGSLGTQQAHQLRNTLNQPLDTSNLPARISNVNTPDYQEGVKSADFQKMWKDPQFQRMWKDPKFQRMWGDPEFQRIMNDPQFKQMQQATAFQRFNPGELENQDYQMGVDFSGAPAMPGDYVAQRDEVINTVNSLASRELDPRYQQEEEALRTRLLNSGVTEGSEAYTRALDDFYRRKDSAYGDARDRAILLGGQEQSRMFGDTLSARDQAIAEELASGQFSNQAAELANRYGIDARTLALGEQAYNNDLTRQETDYGRDQLAYNNDLSRLGADYARERIMYGNELEGRETDYFRNRLAYNNELEGREADYLRDRIAYNNDLTGRETDYNRDRIAYNNELEQLGFGNRMSQADLRNRSRAMAFADELSRAGLRNSQRDAQLQEDVLRRELPLSEFMALQPYGQAQMPMAGNVPQVGGPGGAPILDAALAQNQHAMNLYGQQVGQTNAYNQGMTGLATTGIMAGAMIY